MTTIAPKLVPAAPEVTYDDSKLTRDFFQNVAVEMVQDGHRTALGPHTLTPVHLLGMALNCEWEFTQVLAGPRVRNNPVHG